MTHMHKAKQTCSHMYWTEDAQNLTPTDEWVFVLSAKSFAEVNLRFFSPLESYPIHVSRNGNSEWTGSMIIRFLWLRLIKPFLVITASETNNEHNAQRATMCFTIQPNFDTLLMQSLPVRHGLRRLCASARRANLSLCINAGMLEIWTHFCW